jgi:hypothetical protein
MTHGVYLLPNLRKPELLCVGCANNFFQADVKDWITILPHVADMLRDVGMIEYETHWVRLLSLLFPDQVISALLFDLTDLVCVQEAPYPELGAVRRGANLILLNFERLKAASTQPENGDEGSGEDEEDEEDDYGFGYDALAAAAASAAAAAVVTGATPADAAAAGVAAAAKLRG